MKYGARAILMLMLWIGSGNAAVRAHEGPPFPVLVDQQAGPYKASVWTDPDIGIATFFVVLEPLKGQEFRPPARVSVTVRPVSERLPAATYVAESQRARLGGRYYAEVEFDEGEFWDVWVRVEGDAEHQLHVRVEATPDGTIGPIGLVVYALPFVAIGVLWARALTRRRRHRAAEGDAPPGGVGGR